MNLSYASCSQLVQECVDWTKALFHLCFQLIVAAMRRNAEACATTKRHKTYVLTHY